MNATLDRPAHKATRAKLQAQLEKREELEAAKNRALQELEAAQALVNSHQRTQGYLEAFETAFSRAAQAFNDLDNVIPNQLVNSCVDRELKDQFEVAISIRAGLIAEHTNAKQGVKRAEMDLLSTRRRISEQNGEPWILNEGDSLPWGETFLKKTFSAMQVALGQAQSATWAISADQTRIEFSPAFLQSDAAFYRSQWNDDLRSLRMARAQEEVIRKRLDEAHDELADVKQRMIWSEI